MHFCIFIPRTIHPETLQASPNTGLGPLHCYHLVLMCRLHSPKALERTPFPAKSTGGSEAHIRYASLYSKYRHAPLFHLLLPATESLTLGSLLRKEFS